MDARELALKDSARWFAELRPLRILWVTENAAANTERAIQDRLTEMLVRGQRLGDRGQGAEGGRTNDKKGGVPEPGGNDADGSANPQSQNPKSWIESLADEVRPGVAPVSIDELDTLNSTATFDLAYCPSALLDLPVGHSLAVIDELRRRCRFLIVGVRTGWWTVGDPTIWRRTDFASCGMLERIRGEDRDLILSRGGADAKPSLQGRIVYLSPNREIRGGVRVLYQHVAILNSIGIPSALAVREKQNVPASWFAWKPSEMVYEERAAVRTTARDTIVIPEFRFREASKYQHVACRLLFAQNPGLCFEIDTWKDRGYDGVLTLGCPDGTKSKLHEFLDARTDLPIFAITNHYSDDPWGKAGVPRVPGRILCLPRKGPEFVERLQREFSGIATVDDVPQTRMAVEYARSDVYVHTGFPEGQPMPPIEAMLSGCIVCGFTGQGGLDVMRDGRTAYVAKDGNYEQLANALQRALEDSRRERVRDDGQELARQFHRSVTTAELERCYRDWSPSLNASPRSRMGAVANRIFRVA